MMIMSTSTYFNRNTCVLTKANAVYQYADTPSSVGHDRVIETKPSLLSAIHLFYHQE